METKPPPNRKRPNRITVRMSDEEYSKYEERVSKSGMTANAFSIKCLNNKTIIQKTSEEIAVMVKIQKQLSSIGNNLNQITRLANADGSPPTITAIEMLKDEVNMLWQSLRQAREGKL